MGLVLMGLLLLPLIASKDFVSYLHCLFVLKSCVFVVLSVPVLG
jgi:hypothetical protein